MNDSMDITDAIAVLQRTLEEIDAPEARFDPETPLACLGGITLILALTDRYGPEWFTEEEVEFIQRTDVVLADTIKEFIPR